ncbi:MAG: hypothetical protein ACE5HQ_12090 [Gemmatimonadota bacterium]
MHPEQRDPAADPESEPGSETPAGRPPPMQGEQPGVKGGAESAPRPEREREPPKEPLPPTIRRFLRTLALALQKHSMYPSGHPVLAPVGADVLIHLREAQRQRPVLSFGIGSTQLAFEGTESDPADSRLTYLAGRLHRHRLAAVTFSEGVEREELADFLGIIGTEAEVSGQPLGAAPPEELARWPHIRLQAIHYERLGLADESAVSPPGRSSQLWLGLARAALVRHAVAEYGGLEERPPDLDELDATAVAGALEEYSTDAAYAEEVFTHLLAMFRELRSVPPEGPAREIRIRASELISLLQPSTLRRLLGASDDAEGRNRLLVDAASCLQPKALLNLLEADLELDERGASTWLLLMLKKLAQYSTSRSPAARAVAAASLRDLVSRLAADWARVRNLPPDYAAALRWRSDRTLDPTAPNAGDEIVEPVRLLELGIELRELGEFTWRSLSRMIELREFSALVALLEQGGPESETVQAIWARLASPAAIERMLEERDPDLEALDRLVEHTGTQAAEPMLQALANAPSRTVRNHLFQRLSAMGPDIAPVVIRHLDDERWYVRRNMLALLSQSGRCPPDWSPAAYATDRHPAVRREACKLMLSSPEFRDSAVCHLLADADTRCLALGLSAAQESAPEEAVPHLLRHIADDSLAPELRAMAVRGLARLGAEEALEPLLELVSRPATWPWRLFGRVRSARKSAAVLEGLRALRTLWSREPRVRSVLARAARSRDPEVRRAALGSAGP